MRDGTGRCIHGYSVSDDDPTVQECIDAYGRDWALVAWCEREDYDPNDGEAPHVQAFLAGYDAGRLG